jgi:hypothetical protein
MDVQARILLVRTRTYYCSLEYPTGSKRRSLVPKRFKSLWYTVPHKEHARLFANERLIRPTGTGNTGYF